MKYILERKRERERERERERRSRERHARRNRITSRVFVVWCLRLSSFELITVVQLINVVSSVTFESGLQPLSSSPPQPPLNDDIIERLIFHAITTRVLPSIRFVTGQSIGLIGSVPSNEQTTRSVSYF